MKTTFYTLVALVCSIAIAQAQLKTISLDDSVLQQNRAFRADKLTGFQWIPNSNSYVYYTDSWTKMMQASATNTKKA